MCIKLKGIGTEDKLNKGRMLKNYYVVFCSTKIFLNWVKNIQRLFEPDFVRKNNINLHTFRHTYAHNMLNKGVPKEVLQTLLGHRSIKTTEIYANWVRKEELERWVT